MFTVTVEFQEIGKFNTFKEAFKAFYEKVNETIQRGTSLMALEQTNFIEYTTQKGQQCVMDFYQAKVFAHEIGLLTEDGKLNETVEEPSEPAVAAAFLRAQFDNCAADIQEALKIMNRIQEIVS